MEARRDFIRDLESGVLTMSEVCRRHGISRKTGYKWKRQHGNGGACSLVDKSRKPHVSPQKSGADLERVVVLAMKLKKKKAKQERELEKTGKGN